MTLHYSSKQNLKSFGEKFYIQKYDFASKNEQIIRQLIFCCYLQ